MHEKVNEVYFTLLIEWIWGKERDYGSLSQLIEMGDGIYGAEAVAKVQFKKAGSISRPVKKRLGRCVPAEIPRKFNSGKPFPYMLKRQGQILFPLMGKLLKIQMVTEPVK